MAENLSLSKKVALITGAGRGIGKAIAMLYAEKGADLVLVGKSKNVETVRKEINRVHTSIKCLSLIYDITKMQNLKLIVKNSLEQFNKIDILVNNAGVVFLSESVKMQKNDWDAVFQINLSAPFFLSKIVATEMIKRKYGKIINIASLAGVLGYENRAAYCSSKAGLIGLTRALAYEWAKYNITVNSISPTVTLTDMADKAWSGARGEKMKAKIPLGRFIYPEEVAAAASFLASDDANMITGENIIIDGGYSIN